MEVQLEQALDGKLVAGAGARDQVDRRFETAGLRYSPVVCAIRRVGGHGG